MEELRGDPIHGFLTVEYIDTPDRELTRAGCSLRRVRDVDSDRWRLSIAQSFPNRWEMHSHLPGDRVPSALRARVAEIVGDSPLVRVATSVIRPGSSFVDGPCLDVISSRSPSPREGARGGSMVPSHLELSGAATQATELVLAFMGHQVGRLQVLEAAVLGQLPHSIHRARVATRRLRSALRIFGHLVGKEYAQQLNSELGWYSRLMGVPRDAEVAGAEVLRLLAELSVEGPERDRFTDYLDAQRTKGHAALMAGMRSRRFDALQRSLEALLLDLPLGADYGDDAETLPMLLERGRARVRKLAQRAARGPSQLERWHDVRKAAKAVRYCTEALASPTDSELQPELHRWIEVTKGFGALQDSAAASGLITAVRLEADAAGEPVATYDFLLELQAQRARAGLMRGQEALKVMSLL